MNARVQQANHYQDIVNAMDQALLVVDGELTVQFANPAYYSRFGVGEHATVGKPLFTQHTTFAADSELKSLLSAVAKHGVTVDSYAVEDGTHSKGQRTISLAARRMKRNGVSTDHTLISLHDITGVSPAHNPCAAADHTNTQIAQIHHRVKNNLGSVLAMLRLERRLVDGTPASDILERIALRMEAVAALYDLLAKNGSAGAIRLQSYLRMVCNSIEEVAGRRDGAWTITITGDDMLVSVDEGLNIGAVVNELIAHVTKNPAPSFEPVGRIVVNLERHQTILVMTVSGDAHCVDLPTPGCAGAGVGMKLVQVLLQAMNGSMERTSTPDDGTKITLAIPIRADEPEDVATKPTTHTHGSATHAKEACTATNVVALPRCGRGVDP
ncbi:MAG: histidine kinase dimerization/phosphoacceptor domain -containing protein [Pseudomonadota bacterium]